MHISLSRLRAVVIFFFFFGIVEGRARFAVASIRAASGEAASREKNNDCWQTKFCRNIMYVSSTLLPARSTKFGSKQSEKGERRLRNSHPHV